MITFILNRQLAETTLPGGTTLLDYIRYHRHLKGTKIGCREGDCGACTVLSGRLVNDHAEYITVTSCLTPLQNIEGCHVVTIEGINADHLTPVQEAVASEGGTQCGFCTPGFIMSFTGGCLNKEVTENSIATVDGNICRCTGYHSLMRAGEKIAALAQPGSADLLTSLISKGIVPAYFSEIPERLKKITKKKAGAGVLTGGGTDLYVQKHEEMQEADIHSTFQKEDKEYIYEKDGKLIAGASVTVSMMRNSELFNRIFPDLKKHLRLVSSTPIRNMATLAGNFVNASPIGDMTIFFLAMNASVKLKSESGERSILLRDFYKGYKQLDKKSDEQIEELSFEIPHDFHFSFEKVSKRTHLDIASVNSACSYGYNGSISNMHLSAGGVWPFPKYLAETAAFLEGKKIAAGVLIEAAGILQREIKPISDARGSDHYKRLLAQQLFLAHFQKHLSEKEILDCIHHSNSQLNNN